MAGRVVPLFVLSLAGCVAPYAPACTSDADQDGICDEVDVCPRDGLDDADGDGVCGDVDTCPGGDDRVDVDEDGVPDACDACPDDAANDGDGDGICAAQDPCPEDADDACSVKLFLAMQVDVFPEEAAWQLLDFRSSLLANGGFSDPGEGFYREIEVPAGRPACVTLRDQGRDGGVRGMVFSRAQSLRLAAWDGDSYGSGSTVCFTPGEDGVPFTPPREDAWLADGACDVDLRIVTGGFPQEIGWSLEDDAEREIDGRPAGTYFIENDVETYRFTLTDGEYVLRMFDDFGNGWEADGANFRIGLPGGVVLVDGTLASVDLDGDGTRDGFGEGWQGFSLDCD